MNSAFLQTAEAWFGSLPIEQWFDLDLTPAAAASGSSVLPGAGSIQVIGLAPSLTSERLIAPAAGLVTFTGLVPGQSRETTVRPEVGSIRFPFDGLAPRLDYDPHPFALRMVGLSPTLQLSFASNATTLPDVGALQTLGLVPVLYTERGIQPGVGLIAFGGLSPNALDENAIGPSTGIITLAGLAPTLYAEALVQPGVGLITLDGLVPTVIDSSAGSAILPDVGQLTLFGQAPDLQLTAPVAQHVALVIQGLAPTLVAGVALNSRPRRGRRPMYFEPAEQIQLPITAPNVPEPTFEPILGHRPHLPIDVQPALDNQLAELRARRRRRDEESIALLLAA